MTDMTTRIKAAQKKSAEKYAGDASLREHGDVIPAYTAALGEWEDIFKLFGRIEALNDYMNFSAVPESVWEAQERLEKLLREMEGK